MDAAVADVVTSLEGLAGAGEAFLFSTVAGSAAVPAPPPHSARARLLSAIRVAQMTANADDGEPIREVLEAVNRPELTDPKLTDLLVGWRRGEITAEETATRIRGLSSGDLPTLKGA